jgi:hypothetical protein
MKKVADQDNSSFNSLTSAHFYSHIVLYHDHDYDDYDCVHSIIELSTGAHELTRPCAAMSVAPSCDHGEQSNRCMCGEETAMTSKFSPME